MKKIKWILPLTLLGSVAATIPTISSCSNEWDGAIDTTKDIKYKYKKLEGTNKTPEESWKLFQDMLLEHPDVFTEVLAHGIYRNYRYDVGGRELLLLSEPESKLKVENLHIEKIDEVLRASFDMKLRRKIYARSRSSWKDKSSWEDDDYVITVKANKIPILWAVAAEGYYINLFKMREYANYSNWSLELSATGRLTDNSLWIEDHYPYVFSDFKICVNQLNCIAIASESSDTESKAILSQINISYPIDYLDGVTGKEYYKIDKQEVTAKIPNRTIFVDDIVFNFANDLSEEIIPTFYSRHVEGISISVCSYDQEQKSFSIQMLSRDPIEIGSKHSFDLLILYRDEQGKPLSRYIIPNLTVNFVKG